MGHNQPRPQSAQPNLGAILQTMLFTQGQSPALGGALGQPSLPKPPLKESALTSGDEGRQAPQEKQGLSQMLSCFGNPCFSTPNVANVLNSNLFRQSPAGSRPTGVSSSQLQAALHLQQVTGAAPKTSFSEFDNCGGNLTPLGGDDKSELSISNPFNQILASGFPTPRSAKRETSKRRGSNQMARPQSHF